MAPAHSDPPPYAYVRTLDFAERAKLLTKPAPHPSQAPGDPKDPR